jgi:hypothetical protein
VGVDLADPAVLSAELAPTLDALRARLDTIPAADVAGRVGTNLMQRTRPEPIGPLAQLAVADALTGETRVRLRAALRARVESDADGVRLVLLDRTITLPTSAADAIKVVLAGHPFAPAELPGLDADGQLTLTRRLLREGVLVPR